MLGRREPRHIFHKAKDRYTHFLVLVHVYSLPCIRECHLLGCRNDDSARNGERLYECEMNIACTRRRVQYEVVEIAPIAIANELL